MYSFIYMLALTAANVTVTQDTNAVTQALAQSHGAPVLLHFWATWCAPCVRDFPHFVKLAKKIKVISVSVDLPEGIDSHVRPFLEKQHADFSTLILDVDDPDKIMHAIDPKWSGGIPASFVFDQNGKLVARFFGKADGLERAVTEVLKK